MTKAAVALLALVATVVSGFPTQIVDASSRAPRSPAVTSVSATKFSSRQVRVTVTLKLAPSSVKDPIVSSQIRAGKKVCTVLPRKNNCSFVGVKKNAKIRIAARSKTKSGKWTKWSQAVSFTASESRKWHKTKTQVNRSLLISAKAQPHRFVKLQALSGVRTSTVVRQSTRTASASSPDDIVFRVNSVVALAQTVENDQVGSGLITVLRNGETSDALLSGSASISEFYAAPGGKFFVLFSTPTSLVAGGEKCLLAEVSEVSGVPSCVDSSLKSVHWLMNSPVQFDASGRIYYVGSTINGTQVLRRHSGGASIDLANEEVEIRDFYVLGDGSVLLTGATRSTQAHWVRRISSSGVLSTLAQNVQASFITKFADGNVYLGTWSLQYPGVRKYIPATGSFDSTWWITGNLLSNSSGMRNSYNDADAICANENRFLLDAFCSHSGAYVSSIFSLPGQSTYAVAGHHGWSSRVLMEYYPTVRRVPTSVSHVYFAKLVESKIVIAGTSAGSNTLTIYDPASGAETIVIDAANEIEVYSVTYSPGQRTLVFSGLRFSDNSIVTGEIAMP
jgi:hypothetical protein